ncbi:MAG: dienelactone hydrolase family protein [Allosphingosinicella sp.]|uniref:dienelactone hydrolase family protein n=1 Tax=Allosphingosinicella sp. TaxID=2823234 RepID=UPI0039497A1C
MCERDQLEAWPSGGASDWAVNRRQAALAGLGALAACATGPGDPGRGLTEDRVRFAGADGTVDGFFVAPARGAHPGIVTWPDVAGVREAFEMMARRLAAQGHAVLAVNPYYRHAPAPQFADFPQFRASGGFEKVAPWRAALTAEAIGWDARAAIAWLDARPEVDGARGIGTHGYCMGGPFAVWTAAAVPERVRAAASLHGGGLVRADDPRSPHRQLAASRAGFLFAIGRDDDARAPEVKTALREAAAAAGREAEVEVYPADHGWTVPDSPAYDTAAAERAWARMSALFAAL